MAFDVFISYSSKDKPAADAACAVLESRGLRCWIAPRDILPGADWSQSIIDAINECQVMVLIFSRNANASPQVKREVERTVNRGRPIIPFRIEEVLPAKALEYFLSTPHWLDAFVPPMDQHLERLAATIQQLLSQPGTDVPPPPPPPPARKAWRRYVVPTAITVAACAALALLAVIAFRGEPVKNPDPGGPPALDGLAKEKEDAQPKKLDEPKAPAPATTGAARLIGRWQGDIPDDNGKKHTGLMDVKDPDKWAEFGTLKVEFSDTFAQPFGGANGVVYFTIDKTMDHGSGDVPRTEQDTGSFHVVAGTGKLAGMCRLEDSDKTLVMRVKGGTEIRWTRVTADAPLAKPVAILPEPAEWPVKDVNGLARRAREYVRGRWQPDAEPVNVELECEFAFGKISELKAGVLFRSAATGKGLQLRATAAGVVIGETENGRDYPTLPSPFPELSEVMTQKAVTARQVLSVELQYRWYYDNKKRPNLAMLPCPYPKDDFYWLLRTEKKWHYVPVPADKK